MAAVSAFFCVELNPDRSVINKGDTVVVEDTIEPFSDEIGKINRDETFGVSKADPY
jgi:hypothetical protein